MIKQIHISFQELHLNSIELNTCLEMVILNKPIFYILAFENVHVRVLDLNIAGFPAILIGKLNLKFIIIDILLNFWSLVHDGRLFISRIASGSRYDDCWGCQIDTTPVFFFSRLILEIFFNFLLNDSLSIFRLGISLH